MGRNRDNSISSNSGSFDSEGQNISSSKLKTGSITPRSNEDASSSRPKTSSVSPRSYENLTWREKVERRSMTVRNRQNHSSSHSEEQMKPRAEIKETRQDSDGKRSASALRKRASYSRYMSPGY